MAVIRKKDISWIETYAEPKNVPAAKNNSKHKLKTKDNGYLRIVSNTFCYPKYPL